MTDPAIYSRAEREVAALLDGSNDPISAMAGCAAVLHRSLEQASWTGFYRVVAPGLLRVGPYQGPPACIEIPFERGVCGAAASRAAALVVPDVHAFEGHIACDPESRSEVVVPVFDARGAVVAVLDIDSRQPGAFDDADRQALERIARLLTPLFGS